MSCGGGCLQIHNVIYSCREHKISNVEQLKKVQKMCDRKRKCTVFAKTKMLRNFECPGSPDSRMNLLVVYSCNGEDRTVGDKNSNDVKNYTEVGSDYHTVPQLVDKISLGGRDRILQKEDNNSREAKNTAEFRSNLHDEPEFLHSNELVDKNSFKMTRPKVAKALLSPQTIRSIIYCMKGIRINTNYNFVSSKEGGTIQLKCKGGCLKVHELHYSCKGQDIFNDEHLKKVQKLCDYWNKCTVVASRKMFGNEVCHRLEDRKMNLGVTYSCNGGIDETTRYNQKLDEKYSSRKASNLLEN